VSPLHHKHLATLLELVYRFSNVRERFVIATIWPLVSVREDALECLLQLGIQRGKGRALAVYEAVRVPRDLAAGAYQGAAAAAATAPPVWCREVADAHGSGVVRAVPLVAT